MLARLLGVTPDELSRSGPLFALYLVLFAALTLADGLSLALFVQKVGAEGLPQAYFVSAVAVWVLVGLYVRQARRLSADQVFVLLLVCLGGLFGLVWAMLMLGAAAQTKWLMLLLVAREIAFTLVLLHFGTYLLDYFTRIELTRVMPLIYGGGRVGGLVAGGLLVTLPHFLAVRHLALVVVGLLALAIVGVVLIRRHVPPVTDEPSGPQAIPADDPPRSADEQASIIRLIRRWPLLYWLTLSTLAFFACRGFLSYQYSATFEATFDDDSALAEFLGYYALVALMVAFILQMIVVSRLVGWIGVQGAYLAYAAVVLAVAAWGSVDGGLAVAVAARFVEGELRYGLRNPVSQMVVNQFPKPIRLRARAWTLGTLIPIAAAGAAVVLGVAVHLGWESWIAVLTLLVAAVYFAMCLGVVRNFDEPTPPRWRLRPRRWFRPRRDIPEAADIRG